jgi:beta-lactam-binding protein with PASTA domain
VIEQNKSGNMKRDEELKLTFSYGQDEERKEIKLRDLSGMSKFEATFYLKQNRINYEFEEVFSSKVKRGFVVKQSVKAGTMINTGDTKIIVSISKGPEIKIPNLKGMSMTDITEWVIKNKLKLEFTDKYDDSIDENSVISANYKEGDIVAEGTVIEVVISRGKLIMPEFNSYYEFKEWADKYGILYEEQREFNESVKAGDVISYSYKTGDTIRNNDPVVVTISNGKSASVPSVIGLSKADATAKLKNAGFGYSFVYSYSDSVAQGKVIRQSISAGSKVAQGTTITVTISNGPKPAPPKPVCNPVSVTIQSSLNGSSVAQTSANYRAAYPNVKFNFVPKASNIGTTGMVHPDTARQVTLSGTTCDAITIYIIQN